MQYEASSKFALLIRSSLREAIIIKEISGKHFTFVNLVPIKSVENIAPLRKAGRVVLFANPAMLMYYLISKQSTMYLGVGAGELRTGG